MHTLNYALSLTSLNLQAFGDPTADERKVEASTGHRRKPTAMEDIPDIIEEEDEAGDDLLDNKDIEAKGLGKTAKAAVHCDSPTHYEEDTNAQRHAHKLDLAMAA